ncbi:DHA1 family multidrug resistance protein-like MFS transporter [Serinibacter salmoneus]|uniref:DHA1 family multidrug resistance protein-like MFS transporter n=1 Tax=Serinibacter salmoneus TaxID=556530 RepID=A0A2A9CYT7_9MICO|nr:DHA1 family multidrug resistance protein-like MFS transporter [Serinibacter salmoneus]
MRGVAPRHALWVLYADTLTMAVGFYMLVPLLAYHFLENLGLAVAVVGMLAAIRGAAQNGTQPIAGWIADRIGYRTAISGGVLIRASGFAVLGLTESLPILVAGSILAGLGGALFHPASYAAYAAFSAGRDQTRVYATRELYSNVGFVLGPMIGGLLAGLEFRWVALGSATLFLVAFVITVVGLPPVSLAHGKERAKIGAALRDRRFVPMLAMVGTVWMLSGQLYLVVPVRAAAVLDGSFGVGLVYTSAAVFMVATMLPLTGFASRHLPPGRVIALGGLSLGAGIAVMGLWDSVVGLVAGALVFTVGQMLTQPTVNSLISQFAEPHSIATYFGAAGLARAIGGIVGNLAGGALYTIAGGGGALSTAVWFVFVGVGLAVATLLWTRGPGGAPPSAATSGTQ